MSVAFSFLDVAVVAVVLVSAIYATYRGLVSESLAIFGWVAAAYATLYFGPWASYWMSGMVTPEWLGEVIGYAVVFLIVLLPLAFASGRISENVKKSQVGTIDSVLGTGFGILRGIAIIGVSYLVFTAVVPYERQPDWVVNARLYPLIHASADIVSSLIPDQHGRAPRHGPDPIARKIEESAAPPRRAPDPIAQKIEESRPIPSPRPRPVKHVKKRYGAKDRHALDKLIETTDSDQSGKP